MSILQHVFIVSDGTGQTATQALDAALVQFETVDVETHLRPDVRTEQQVLEIVSEAHEIHGLIIHTIVSKNLRHLILEEGRLHDINTIDLMGPLLARLSHHFVDFPSEKPGIFHEINKAYFQRIEAVEFTFRHDDGLRTEELHSADIVLLGVSRTFKTPLSVYMAHKGWSVANVPIIFGHEPPEILSDLPPERVFCLTTNPRRLAELRHSRDKHLGGLTGNYSNREYVRDELNFALRYFRKHPKWTIVNITFKPIEEISSEILSHLRGKGKVAQ